MRTGQVNLPRAVAGGLLAGLVMNISELVLHGVVLGPDGEALQAEWQQLGLVVTADPMMLLLLVLATFALGIMAVWTYAAIRPRFGAGVGTAACAGLLVWALSYGYAAIYVHAAVQIYPPRLTWLPVAWSLIEVPVATIVGAWIYRE